jgi:arginine decarboxylase
MTTLPLSPDVAPSVDATWSIEDARALYNVEGWGSGYFDINPKGHVVVRPDRDHPDREVDLFELAQDLEAQGVAMPVLLRFSDLLRSRVRQLSEEFEAAIKEYGYTGKYTTVFPIKVNQQRHVVEEIHEFGQPYGVGLECGSKPELQAVIALTDKTDHLIVCNGYKDHEFMRLALISQKLGHRVFIVLEQLSELDVLLEVADELGVVPTAGVRIKLASAGFGRWAQSGGEKSKFGLNVAQLVKLIDRLKALGRLDILKLIHFHLGSQIPDIRYIKAGLQEVARFYTELRRMGVDVTYVDVGGGLGVDYDGTNSTAEASVNYTPQEYANDVVYTMAEACREHELPMPNLISESGRALTAHHAMLLVKVIDVETNTVPMMPELKPRKVREIAHDASFDKDRARQYFSADALDLRSLAIAEQLHLGIMNGLQRIVRSDVDEFEDIVPEVEAALTDRYFCNFSLFQSLPDHWAIDQLFPVMPVHRLGERPDRMGTLQDVTCDSDGKIDHFVGDRSGRPSLELHVPKDDEDYVLGIFLTGAYQEILGDLHNLFGDTNAVHVKLDDNGRYIVNDIVHGDTVTEVLNYVQFHAPNLLATFRRKVQNASGITRSEANTFIADYVAGLEGYTYLEGEAAR